MKVKLLFVIATFVCLHDIYSQASKYHPFPNSNAVWRVNSEQDNGMGTPYCAFYQYTIGGDTIIGAYTYKKIYRSGFFNCTGICGGTPPGFTSYSGYCSIYSNDTYYGGLRQDSINKKVYFKDAYTSSGESLIYDFTKLVGDSVFVGGFSGGYVKITSIDSVLVGSNYHKRFNVYGSGGGATTPPNSAIIEGVGATSGLLEPLFLFEYGSGLVCFSHYADIYPSSATACPLMTNSVGIKQYYTNNNINIYPNPSNGNVTIVGSNNIDELKVSDILGQTVYETKPNAANTTITLNNTGVYFVTLTSGTETTTKKVIVNK